ncbi:hypothetical protein IC762_23050 [Bradyrhizobium genosp. L]|uniref:hypothetical protein n=1 Tax=Bradyrhizobium genosp. L TaxID=83637 RepID=UPI0018A2CE08|nr:hypothetical protein [Bradyrhizobium genosp. L]QPF82614.1 hypothetical protein IC762_23050 [Bradyrhizobium genosp. L]
MKDLEAKAIDEAYKDRLSGLFGTLFGNLLNRAGQRNGEQQSFDDFKHGLAVARRALELAREAAKPAAKIESA